PGAVEDSNAAPLAGDPLLADQQKEASRSPGKVSGLETALQVIDRGVPVALKILDRRRSVRQGAQRELLPDRAEAPAGESDRFDDPRPQGGVRKADPADPRSR